MIEGRVHFPFLFTFTLFICKHFILDIEESSWTYTEQLVESSLLCLLLLLFRRLHWLYWLNWRLRPWLGLCLRLLVILLSPKEIVKVRSSLTWIGVASEGLFWRSVIGSWVLRLGGMLLSVMWLLVLALRSKEVVKIVLLSGLLVLLGTCLGWRRLRIHRSSLRIGRIVRSLLGRRLRWLTWRLGWRLLWRILLFFRRSVAWSTWLFYHWLWNECIVLLLSFFLFLSHLIRSFHAELAVLTKEKYTYFDYFSVLLTSLDMSGSILILFSDYSNTLMAFIHSVLLILTSEG